VEARAKVRLELDSSTQGGGKGGGGVWTEKERGEKHPSSNAFTYPGGRRKRG